MDTQIFRHPTDDELYILAQALRNGDVVAIPTETVYGLGANGLDPDSMDKIYAAKGRPSDNPLILHVPDADSIAPLVTEIPQLAKELMDAFWPGPLTITLPKSDLVPDRATCGLDRVALRCPNHELCRRLLKAAGVPIAAPSANISGRPSPTTAEAVYADMNGRIPYILDDGPCTIGVESTVVEVGPDMVTILRPGGITKEMLETIVSHVRYDTALSNSAAAPKAPGMKYTHYAPDAPMVTFVGTPQEVCHEILNDRKQRFDGLIGDIPGLKHTNGPRIAYLLSEETYELLEEAITEPIQIYGHHNDAVGLAHDLYSALHSFNEYGVDFIYAEGVYNESLGVAVMNRLEKASSGAVIYL